MLARAQVVALAPLPPAKHYSNLKTAGLGRSAKDTPRLSWSLDQPVKCIYYDKYIEYEGIVWR
jgi:hypothetical protein